MQLGYNIHCACSLQYTKSLVLQKPQTIHWNNVIISPHLASVQQNEIPTYPTFLFIYLFIFLGGGHVTEPDIFFLVRHIIKIKYFTVVVFSFLPLYTWPACHLQDTLLHDVKTVKSIYNFWQCIHHGLRQKTKWYRKVILVSENACDMQMTVIPWIKVNTFSPCTIDTPFKTWPTCHLQDTLLQYIKNSYIYITPDSVCIYINAFWQKTKWHINLV